MVPVKTILWVHAVVQCLLTADAKDTLNSSSRVHSDNLVRDRRQIIGADDGGLFGNFAELDHDLEESYLPNEIAGRFEAVAVPPPKEKGQRQCPQCFASPPEIFPKIYCSSKLSAKIRFLGRHQLDVLEDMSPDSRGMTRTNRVSYTMKPRCQCDLIGTRSSMALLVVTPPRTFNLKSIQLIHLDDSITLLPWNTTEPFISSIPRSSTSCYQMLTAT